MEDSDIKENYFREHLTRRRLQLQHFKMSLFEDQCIQKNLRILFVVQPNKQLMRKDTKRPKPQPSENGNLIADNPLILKMLKQYKEGGICRQGGSQAAQCIASNGIKKLVSKLKELDIEEDLKKLNMIRDQKWFE